jgi:hypothetical protein
MWFVSLGGLFPTFRKLVMPSASGSQNLLELFDGEYEGLTNSVQNTSAALGTLQPSSCDCRVRLQL